MEFGRTYDSVGHDAEAEETLREALTILEENFGSEDARTGRARASLQAHYERRGLAERAAELGGDSDRNP